MTRHRSRPWTTAAAVLCALLFGVALRSSLEPSPAKTFSNKSVPVSQEARLAQESVEAFYRGVITGDFRSSATHALEADIPDARKDTTVLAGNVFAAQLLEELGPYGLNTGIAKLSSRDLGPVRPEAITDLKEYRVLSALGSANVPLRAVEISGRLVGRCSIGALDRVVIVASWEGSWKILLEGRQGPKQPHFETWFLTRQESHSGGFHQAVADSGPARGV